MRLEIETIYLFTHSGHWMRNTVGVHGNFSPKMPPHTLWPDVYLTPMHLGQVLISYLHLVGLRVDSCSSVLIYLIAIRIFGFRWRNTNSGSRARIRLTGLNSPFAYGMEMNAWQSLYGTDCNYLKLMAPIKSYRCHLFVPWILLDIMSNRVSRFSAASQIFFLMS